ncbi:MAG: hypothetical protein RI947_1552 [Candidatus Parcubacteria bacterium]|jgi:hypothetical protein
MTHQHIFIIGGMHGNEPTGISVARYFSARKIPGITGILAHPQAITNKTRYIETDLNRSFSASLPTSLEEHLADSLKPRLKLYDAIIDIHNTRAAHTTCAIVTTEPTNLQLALAAHFGFSRMVIMPPMGSLISQHPRISISFEIAHNDMKRFRPDTLIDTITCLDLESLSQKKKVTLFRRVGSLQKKTMERTGIRLKELQNFKALTAHQKRLLSLDQNICYCPIFKKDIGEKTVCSIVERM